MISYIYIVLFIVVIAIFLLLASKESDSLSALKIQLFFALPGVLTVIFYCIDESLLLKYGLRGVNFYTDNAIDFAIFLYFLSFLFATLGVILGGGGAKLKSGKLLRLLFLHRILPDCLPRQLVVFYFTIGMIIFGVFCYKIGGLSHLWANSYQRTEITSGYNYLNIVYTSILTIACYYSLISALVGNKIDKIIFIVIFMSTVGVFLVLLQRAPVVMLIFVLMMTYHIKFRSLYIFKMSIRKLLISVVILFGVSSLSEFRDPEYTLDNLLNENPVEIVIKNTLSRVAPLDRFVISSHYFNSNDYWFGSSYKSLLYFYIPSSIYKEKPPIDTGRYMTAINYGYKVEPPVPISKLPKTSQPEIYLAGYNNFGILGLIVVSILSGAFFGTLYQYSRRFGLNSFGTIFFATYAFMGVIPLSPFGIFTIFSTYVSIFLGISPLLILRLLK